MLTEKGKTMREKLIKLLREVQYLGGLEEKIADHLIANGVTIQEWISVSERLPEKRETVLVCDVRENYMNAWEYLGRDEWLWDSSIWRTEAITHWMPLPEPPKGEE